MEAGLTRERAPACLRWRGPTAGESVRPRRAGAGSRGGGGGSRPKRQRSVFVSAPRNAVANSRLFPFECATPNSIRLRRRDGSGLPVRGGAPGDRTRRGATSGRCRGLPARPAQGRAAATRRKPRPAFSGGRRRQTTRSGFGRHPRHADTSQKTGTAMKLNRTKRGWIRQIKTYENYQVVDHSFGSGRSRGGRHRDARERAGGGKDSGGGEGRRSVGQGSRDGRRESGDAG